MKSLGAYTSIKGSAHRIPKGHKFLRATPANERIMVTLILRRRKAGAALRTVKDFAVKKAKKVRDAVNREEFVADHGADPADVAQVVAYAKSSGLTVVETNLGARAVVLRGTAAKLNKAFQVKLKTYQGPLAKYHSHDGAPKLPRELARMVEAVIGLHSRPIHARAHNTSRRRSTADPPNTRPVTPQQVAQLYGFPQGDGTGQTIGIYEMATEDPSTGQLAYAGYTPQDVAATMKGFGGGLKAPNIIDVPIDGTGNSGQNDGETLLDITVAGAIAQAATIAVYFAGAETQNMIHALQHMIHPSANDPVPTIISISYGWGPDDNQAAFSPDEFEQFGQLFQDAANLFITVLVSSGDSGCDIGGTHAQASYPATEPMVIACGGTTAGDINGSTFDEYAWNDVGLAGPGATGGGISVKFPLPSYQNGVGVPKNNFTNKAGRGIPDLAGNASENSGYPQSAGGSSQAVGGTSAVAPLYAGLFARMNSNLQVSLGFVNPIIYSLGKTAFNDIVSPPGPANISFNGITGYPVTDGWDACTGWGSVKGTALQSGLKAANAGASHPLPS